MKSVGTVKTLLIDNYDSYTYNLFQLLAEVNGTEPTVVTNDDGRWPELSLDTFDNVVISPGPGNPENPRDFGYCKDVLADAGLPVLGVCLGHQGIGHFGGAKVTSAPKPQHGHLTTVGHNGDELFADIPNEFSAVRYHSLCVVDLPSNLEAIAWAEDGVIMGLRHRELPQWGVQFHPESIATEYGHALLKNFARLSRTFRSPHSSKNSVANSKPALVAQPPQGTVGVVVDKIDTQIDGAAAFSRLFYQEKWAYWLDSSRAEPGLSRFSFLGYSEDDGVIEYRVGDEASGDIFDSLKTRLSKKIAVSDSAPSTPFEFLGGYVGFFGYELKALCGSPNRHTSNTPDAVWMNADRFIVIDHEEHNTYLVANFDSPKSELVAKQWIETTKAQLLTLPTLASDAINNGELVAEDFLARGRDQYLKDIDVCLEALNAGESYEICLTNKVNLPPVADPFALYLRLRALNPAPNSAFLKLNDFSVASSSPERFLHVDNSRTVETKPIKGTVKRHPNPAVDAELRDSLTSSSKTRAENLMIVDLMRNDLGKVCKVGSVHVPKLMTTETFETVHHLVSTVRGQLKDEMTSVDCVKACFPGGSMTGAPKLRTMQITDGLESEARGIYSGAIGYLGYGDIADLSIVIRTAVCTKDGVSIGTGGAIVLDSDPAEEWEEIVLKTSAIVRAHNG